MLECKLGEYYVLVRKIKKFNFSLVEDERATIERMRAEEKREGRAPILDRFLDFEEV
jgi:hypothetical protein